MPLRPGVKLAHRERIDLCEGWRQSHDFFQEKKTTTVERGQKRVLSRNYFQKAYKGRAVAVLLHTPVLCALPLPPRMSLTLISEKPFLRNSLYQSSCDGRNRAHSYMHFAGRYSFRFTHAQLMLDAMAKMNCVRDHKMISTPPPPPPPASPRDETMSNLSSPFGTKKKKLQTALSIMYKCSLPPLKKVQGKKDELSLNFGIRDANGRQS